LPQAALFPHALLPLHVFEPRYRELLRDAVAGAGLIVLVALRPEEPPDAFGQPAIERVGGIGAIVERTMLPDGRANVVLMGRARVALSELPFKPPYRRAKATLLDDVGAMATQSDRTALVAAAGAFAAEVQRRDARFSFSLPPDIDTAAIADLCAAHLVMDARVRQSLLEERDIAARVRTVMSELAVQRSTLLRDTERGAAN
jgi:ATP-dependent Lon protease